MIEEYAYPKLSLPLSKENGKTKHFRLSPLFSLVMFLHFFPIIFKHKKRKFIFLHIFFPFLNNFQETNIDQSFVCCGI